MWTQQAEQPPVIVPKERGEMTTPSKNVAAPSDLTKCAVCGYRMGLLSRKEDYVVLGCNTCQVSLSLPTATWERLTTQRSM
jgi:hypothetical protein